MLIRVAPSLSYAQAVRLYTPADSPLHCAVYGAVVSVPIRTGSGTSPSPMNSTRVICRPGAGVAVASIVIVAGAKNGSPASGRVSSTSGRFGSGPGLGLTVELGVGFGVGLGEAHGGSPIAQAMPLSVKSAPLPSLIPRVMAYVRNTGKSAGNTSSGRPRRVTCLPCCSQCTPPTCLICSVRY